MNQSKLDKILGMDAVQRYQNQVKDYDGDKLMNIIDCKPYNKHKQGLVHDIAARFSKGRLKEWGKEGQVAAQQKYYAEKQIRNKSRAAYYQAKEKEEMAASREKARIESERKTRSFREGGFVNRVVSQIGQATRPVNSAPRRLSKKQRKMMARVSPSRQVMPSAKQSMSTDFTSGNVFIK